jgi:hypothetical protein
MTDTRMEPMQPTLLEKNPNMAKGKRGRQFHRIETHVAD